MKHENGAFEGVAKNLALKNMMHLFNVYSNRIMDSDFIAVEAAGTHEFLFSDGGIVAREPWSDERGLPFDIHIPISPKLSIQVIPAPTQAWPNGIIVSYAANSAISIHNRIILAQAKSQVFSRSFPPVSFIKKNWGRSAPDFMAFRRNGSELETKVDLSKFYH